MIPGEDTTEKQAATAHRVARLLRHEAGDLLQSIYSTVAILLERLPEGMGQERRLLADLKTRAETYRDEVDVTVDLLSPQELGSGRVDLTVTLTTAVTQARRRCPAIPIQFDSDVGLAVNADGRALSAALNFFLTSVCQTARKLVRVRLVRDGETVCCLVERDGLPVSNEHRTWLEQPFQTTQQALFGLALANLLRVIRSGGGSLSLGDRPDGGLSVRLLFPVMGA